MAGRLAVAMQVAKWDAVRGKTPKDPIVTLPFCSRMSHLIFGMST